MAPAADPLPAPEAKATEADAQAQNEQAVGHLVLSYGKKYFLHALLGLAVTGWSTDHFGFKPTSQAPAAASVTPEFINRLTTELDEVKTDLERQDSKLSRISDILIKVELREDAQFAVLGAVQQAQVSKIYKQSLAAIDVKQELNGGHP